jgi:hypothetical protein
MVNNSQDGSVVKSIPDSVLNFIDKDRVQARDILFSRSRRAEGLASLDPTATSCNSATSRAEYEASAKVLASHLKVADESASLSTYLGQIPDQIGFQVPEPNRQQRRSEKSSRPPNPEYHPFSVIQKSLFGKICKESESTPPQFQKYEQQKARDIMSKARAIESQTWAARKEENIKHRMNGYDLRVRGGAIGKSAMLVLEVLCFLIWPICNEVMRPSVAHIAHLAKLSKRTVFRSQKVLRRMGFLWYERGKMHRSVSEDGTTTWRRETSYYVIGAIRGLAMIGSRACRWPSDRWGQFGTGIETIKNIREATASDTDGYARAPP